MSDTAFRRAATGEVSFARWSAQALAVARGLRVLPSHPTLPAVPEQIPEDAEIEALAVHLGILAPHPAAPSRPTAAGGAR
ncbi:hypothetical protein AB0K93_34975 [Streptomyces sp. NPDC052676]|uniref:hypothetical protein n=1 Tax=Streptomyces sp. NPDC052676 TaxID=3154953 RepID=UPI0034286AD9